MVDFRQVGPANSYCLIFLTFISGDSYQPWLLPNGIQGSESHCLRTVIIGVSAILVRALAAAGDRRSASASRYYHHLRMHT